MTAAPDDQGVSALHIGALQIGVGVAARVDSHTVAVGLWPPALAHFAADSLDQLGPVAWPLTHLGQPRLARPTRRRTRADRPRTGHRRPARCGRLGPSRCAASAPPGHPGPAPATGPRPGLASGC